jgi:hypothetical protein
VAPVHGIKHLLDPGTSSYAALMVSAVAGFAGLQFALRRRSRGRHDGEHAHATHESVAAERRTPHPRSKKKKHRRRP